MFALRRELFPGGSPPGDPAPVEPVRAEGRRAAGIGVVARGRAATARRPSPVRLLVLLAVAAVALLLSSTRVVAESAPVLVTRTVERGDTLWSIAADLAAPGEDVRAVVADIREANDLESAMIRPGQTIVVRR